LGKLSTFIRKLPIIHQVDAMAHKWFPPGFKGLSVGEVYDFYAIALRDSSVLERAYSASFKFFMGLFPGLIFLMTLIPMLPIPNFQTSLLISLEGIIPAKIFPLVEQTVIDVIKNKNTGLLSIGFLVTMVFSTGGMNGIMRAFNDSALIHDDRKPLKQRLYAAGLTFFGFFVLIAMITFIILTNKYLLSMRNLQYISESVYHILLSSKWLVIFFMIYLVIATLFYFAPAKHLRHSFFSPGSIASTLCAILFTYLFTIYINNFSNYNKIYGILGTLPLLLVWIFLNIVSLLIGFELNVSIMSARKQKASEDELPDADEILEKNKVD
jgi:membrane protein